MNVTDLLSRVRQALTGVPAPLLPPLPGVPPLHEPMPDPVATFIAAARAVGAEVLVDSAPDDIPPPSPTTVHTPVACAIAISGTIVLEGAPRLPSALAETHVAHVQRSQIVATLADYLAKPLATPPPTSRVLITGPSKTADIEGILVIGVHGPGRLVIVVTGGPPARAEL